MSAATAKGASGYDGIGRICFLDRDGVVNFGEVARSEDKGAHLNEKDLHQLAETLHIIVKTLLSFLLANDQTRSAHFVTVRNPDHIGSGRHSAAHFDGIRHSALWNQLLL